MAIMAVASVVKEKLEEMMKKESALTFGKVIHNIKIEVDSLFQFEGEGEGGLLTKEEEEEEEEEEDVETVIKDWRREYLDKLYELEDVVETTHAVGIVRRRRKLSYLNLNLTLTLNNFRSRLKMKRIAATLNSHNSGRRPEATRSLNASLDLSNGFHYQEEQAHQATLRSLSMNSYESDDSDQEQQHSDADADAGAGAGAGADAYADSESRLIDQSLTNQLNNKDTDQENELPVIQNESSSSRLPVISEIHAESSTISTTALSHLSPVATTKRRDNHRRRLHPKPTTSFGRRRDNPNSPPHSLSDQEGWKMLLSEAGLEETPVISSVKDKILKLCKGLPLNIALLGGLLSTKKLSSSNSIDDEWLHRLNSWNDSCDILTMCYNDLPAHSQLCLLYSALFEKEFNIPVRRLLRLWVAEGFVRPFQATRAPEDVVQEWFNDLVNRNMIEISKWRSAGSFRSCRLPLHLHDKLLPLARELRLFHVYPNSEVDLSGVRRIVVCSGDIKDCPLPPSELQKLRSYLSFNIQKKDTPAREVGKFVGKVIGKKGLGLLRVLDLENVYKPSLPDNLGDLVHLRYLGLRWTFLDTLPPSIGDLPYLETLDLKHTYIKSLPSSIWKLKHLHHLNLNEIRLDMPQKMPTTLPPLRTLWGLFVDCNSRVKNGLDQLCGLKELGITFNLSCCRNLIDWVAKLTDLQSLRLRSKDERGRPSKLSLKPLSHLKNLSHMNLLGNIQNLPDVTSFPPNLKVLTLSVSQLEDDPMDTLGQLPNLTVLRLLADSFLGSKFVCHRGSFSELQVLKLWMLKGLQEWEVEEGAMKNLRELNIRCCDRLNSIPDSLLRTETLKELILTNMPDDFINSIQLEELITCNELEFGAPLPWVEDETSNGCSFTRSIYG